MATTAPALDSAPVPPGEVARIWALHLTSLAIPALSLVFLWTGPHRWYVGPLFMVPMALMHQLDCGRRRERRQPLEALPAWPFDALVYLLAGLQFWVVYETVQLFTVQSVFSMDMILVFLVVGGSSGFSIITAHELIHRRNRWEQGLGRLLLCTVLYEHFYTEHLRGHHSRVGTAEDPATARFGESYEGFFRRTVPAQFRSAWQLEKKRLGDPDMPLLDRRMLGNRIVHGLAVEAALALAVLGFFGLPSLVAFVAQAFMAVRLLEAVNYFEHWGLVRTTRRVQPVDSWDTHSWFTFYGLIGLSRHADHHAWPARPYQQLRVWDEAPILPYGYVGMVDLVMGQNEQFQQMAAAELGRRRLGPFLSEESGDPAELASEVVRARLSEAQEAEAAARPASREPGPVARVWRRLPLRGRQAAVLAGLVLATAVGVQWESGDGAMGLLDRTLLHAWLFGVFFVVLPLRAWIQERTKQEAVSWLLGGALLLAFGLLTDRMVLPLLGS